ncbi:hypothetical protein CCHR01_03654 [Colletotrichum chrysophilum]|uniref:Uncharacterized protein n=1 Tax=Colletotrichum chrysophilum TaxID=1836956 RepID=A0AAD9ATV0_9PEZI|nr:hypothetical protein CCHR01_03654 [Colletotrichum chrysophilum]
MRQENSQTCTESIRVEKHSSNRCLTQAIKSLLF